MVRTQTEPDASTPSGTVPVLRWAGSKRRLVPRLVPFWGNGYSRYLEPFAGSSALFFALRPKSAILSDINSGLIEALECIRDLAPRVHSRLCALEHSKEAYYKVRAQDPKDLGRVDRAVRFIYLNRYCFNGLYRTNLAGMFNVPFATSGTGGIPSLQVFMRNAALLASAKLINGDFDSVMRAEVQAGDFVYLDPPYAVANRRIFRQYGPQTFGLEDLDRLASLLEHIDQVGAQFLLSYADCKESRTLAKRWQHRRVYVQRNIAGFHKHRRRAGEALITNIAAGEI